MMLVCNALYLLLIASKRMVFHFQRRRRIAGLAQEKVHLIVIAF
jgi:hypothetical protein